MPYEQSKFGDGSAAGSGNVLDTVKNHYGARDTGGAGGVTRTAGFEEELTVDLDAELLSSGEFPAEAPYIKRGAKIHSVYLEVVEAFTGTGTSPTVEVGTEGSEATNGVSVTEAQMEAEGVYDLTGELSGTWAAAGGLTDKTVIGVDTGGTNPVFTGGLARLVIRYISTNSKAPASTYGS